MGSAGHAIHHDALDHGRRLSRHLQALDVEGHRVECPRPSIDELARGCIAREGSAECQGVSLAGEQVLDDDLRRFNPVVAWPRRENNRLATFE